MIFAEDVPRHPAATQAQHHHARLVNGDMSTHEYDVDVPPADVVAFYAERLGPATEVEGGATRWRFVETTTREREVGTLTTLVSVAPRASGGTTLLIGATARTEPRSALSRLLGKLTGRG